MKKQTILVAFLSFLAMSSFGQTKKWTLEECVSYALQNNISIKQSAFDKELTHVTKKDAIGRFMPSVNANASHSWNIGLNQQHYNRFVRKSNFSIYFRGIECWCRYLQRNAEPKSIAKSKHI